MAFAEFRTFCVLTQRLNLTNEVCSVYVGATKLCLCPFSPLTPSHPTSPPFLPFLPPSLPLSSLHPFLPPSLHPPSPFLPFLPPSLPPSPLSFPLCFLLCAGTLDLSWMLVTVSFNWWYVETRHCCSFVVYAMHLIWVFTKDIGFVHGVSFPLYLLGSCPSSHVCTIMA